MKKLEGKIALVTGGTSGIGLATAKLYKENGAIVIVTARTKESSENAKKEFGNTFDIFQTDIKNLEEIDTLYSHIKSKYGKLDILFANAGSAFFEPSSSVTDKSFDNLFDVNVKGLYFSVTKALSLLSKGSSVILTSSAYSTKGASGSSVYSATKAAVRSFARSWTAEILAEDVRFNVISPGPIQTPIYGKVGLSLEQVNGMTDSMLSSIPARRVGQPEEVARVALFLASSDSSYICGADISIDGGLAQI